MKKRLLFLLLILLLLTGCGQKKTEYGIVKEPEKKEEQKEEPSPTKKNKYSYDKISFNLPESYTRKSDNYYFINNDDVTISVDIKRIDDIGIELEDYVKKDDSKYLNLDTLKEVIINNQKWIKVNSKYNLILYYLKYETKVYQVEINPLYPNETVLNETIKMLEETLTLES